MLIKIEWEALAFSASDGKTRRSNKRSKSTSKPTRVTRSTFEKLSKAKQKKYLEHFPKSSHRKLVGKEEAKPEKKPTAKKQKQAKQDKPAKKLKRLSPAAFDQLSARQKRKYIQRYPNSRHLTKHFAVKKPNAAQRAKKGSAGETVLPRPVRSETRKNVNKAQASERAVAKQELRHSITKEAVGALQTVREQDVREAASNLQRNRASNIIQINQQLDNRKQIFIINVDSKEKAQQRINRELEKASSDKGSEYDEKELNTAKEAIEKVEADKETELTDEEQQALKPHVPDMDKKKPFWKKDLEVLANFVTGGKLDPEGRANGMAALGVVARYALIAAGVTAISLGAGPAALHIAQTLFTQWDGFAEATASDDDDGGLNDTEEHIGIAYDAVADYLQHMDVDEFVESIGQTFKEFGRKRAQAHATPDLRQFPIPLVEDAYRITANTAELPYSEENVWGLEEALRQLNYVPTNLSDRVAEFSDGSNIVTVSTQPTRLVLRLENPEEELI